jgi:hypothetical protein
LIPILLDELLNNEDYIVETDETKIIFLKIIEQSIRDYINLKDSKAPIEMQYFLTANDFLFSKDYFIDWGPHEIRLLEILQYLSIDPDWFDRKLKKHLK